MPKERKLDHNGFPTAKTARKQAQDDRLIDELHKFHMRGMTPGQICQELKISKTTYYRYLQKAADREREILDKHFEDKLLTRINWLESVFLETYTICRNIELELEPDPDKQGQRRRFDVGERLAAGNLKCEVAISSIKLLREGPFATIQEMSPELQQKITEATKRENLPQTEWMMSDATKPPTLGLVDKMDDEKLENIANEESNSSNSSGVDEEQ